MPDSDDVKSGADFFSEHTNEQYHRQLYATLTPPYSQELVIDVVPVYKMI